MSLPTWLPTTTLYTCLALLAAFLGAVWWLVPKWQVHRIRLTIRGAKARADLEDNLRKTLSQLIGGVAVIVAAAFAYYQSQVTVAASRDLLISQQVSKGFEQLGSNVVVTRLGGIYALEGVMNASKEYHWPIVEALSAVLRDESPASTESATHEKPLTSVIQTIVTVLGRRNERLESQDELSSKEQLDLSRTNLRGANLRKAHLSGANLTEADLTGAFLRDAELTGADLSGAKLKRARLPAGVLNRTLLNGADLTDAFLPFAELGGAILYRTNLTRAILNNATLTDATLTNADLTEASLAGADLRRANLKMADLSRAGVARATMVGTNLAGAILNLADLSGANLAGAILFGADLRNAILRDTNLSEANLIGANLSGADLAGACGDAQTKLPLGLTIKPCP